MARNYKRDTKGRFSRTGGGRKGPVKDKKRSAALKKSNTARAKKAAATRTRNLKSQQTSSVQSRHRKALAVNFVAGNGGALAGRAIGGTLGASAGPTGLMIGKSYGGLIGATSGTVLANRINNKRGYAITPKEFKSLALADRKAIQKRNTRLARTNMAVMGASFAYGAYKGYSQAMGGNGLNMKTTKRNSANFRNSQSHGLKSGPIVGKRVRGGAYNITTAKPPRRGYR